MRVHLLVVRVNRREVVLSYHFVKPVVYTSRIDSRVVFETVKDEVNNHPIDHWADAKIEEGFIRIYGLVLLLDLIDCKEKVKDIMVIIRNNCKTRE